MSKGRLLFVEGRLTFDSWTSQDGTKRSKHRVTVENFQFLPATPPREANQTQQSETKEGSNNTDTDDIPF